jgi:hypothetical protein
VFPAQKDFRLIDFTPAQCVLFADLEKRPVVLAFDQAHGSSDGGAILLSAANQRFGDGLIESLSSSLQDVRQQRKVDHPLTDLMRQRIYGLACGYEDANDAVRIGTDPMHKLLAGRDPIKGLDLASQPTLSRFENCVYPEVPQEGALQNPPLGFARGRLYGEAKRSLSARRRFVVCLVRRSGAAD